MSVPVETYVRLITALLDNMARIGFRRILIVNGHGGNAPAGHAALDWSARKPGIQVQFHPWWKAPRTMAKAQEIDPTASHANWMENYFPWTRLPGVDLPDQAKPTIDPDAMKQMGPAGARQYLGDGSFGGTYQRSDPEMAALWTVAVDETRDRLENGWIPEAEAS